MNALRRAAFVLPVVLALSLVPASAAVARGDGWEKVELPPFDFECPDGTVLHIEAVHNKEYQRITELPGGTLLVKITGSLKTLVTNTETGTSRLYNTSGPAPVGHLATETSFEFRGTGLNFFFFDPETAEALGLPPMSVTAGPVDLLFTEEGVASLRPPPRLLHDVCAELT